MRIGTLAGLRNRRRLPMNSSTFPLKNKLTNSAWLGGGSFPTTWAQGIATGTSVPNGSVDGNVIYRQSAIAQRPFLVFPTGIPLGVSGSLIGVLEIPQIYSGSAIVSDCVGFSSLPAGATISYWKDGVIVVGTTPISINSRIGAIVTSGGTAGSPQFRCGLGCGGAVTSDIDITKPMVVTGTVPGAYQRTGLNGEYDNTVG